MPDETKKPIRIHIDRVPYEVDEHELTGEQLRNLPTPPIASDFDLWLEERGDVEDELIEPSAVVKLKEDMHFYSAPSKINPGQC
ncbi:MAG TPA: multiubiquitin domain-containing protein [Chloroflexota bacterium]|jgi:hypothetical protein|nr:multiubiquitin domain-containing protein [Chloroflexota bacterium]